MKSNRNKNREQGDGIGSRVAGFVLVVLMLIPVLALWSYDWHDVPWLNAQGGRTPVNLIGLAGAIGSPCG